VLNKKRTNTKNIKSKFMEKDYLIYKLSETIKTTSRIDKELFTQFNVKRGLRNEDHSGVLVGLTKVGDVVGYEKLPEGG